MRARTACCTWDSRRLLSEKPTARLLAPRWPTTTAVAHIWCGTSSLAIKFSQLPRTAPIQCTPRAPPRPLYFYLGKGNRRPSANKACLYSTVCVCARVQGPSYHHLISSRSYQSSLPSPWAVAATHPQDRGRGRGPVARSVHGSLGMRMLDAGSSDRLRGVGINTITSAECSQA